MSSFAQPVVPSGATSARPCPQAAIDTLLEPPRHTPEVEGANPGFDRIIGSSLALRKVLDQVRTVAPTDSTVVIEGETGTGKELVAQAIHAHSRRRNCAFVKLNCAAIPLDLLESELFGHEKGAFTGAVARRVGRFEAADGGTLFLDEIGDIPLQLQPKLLRVLQEREFEKLGSTQTQRVNVRVVAATHRDLTRLISENQFRSDLYYRLNVFPIRIPPLRQHPEDIPALVRYFTDKYARRMGKRIDTISARTLRRLMRWHWPGNVRELENVVERTVILTTGDTLEISEPEWSNSEGSVAPAQDRNLDEEERMVRILRSLVEPAATPTSDSPPTVPVPGLTNNGASAAPATASNVDEQQTIVRILGETKGQVGGANGAAARLGVKRTTLISRMKKLGIDGRQIARRQSVLWG